MPADLRISVVWSPGPRQIREVHVTLQPGSTVADAVQASGLTQEFSELSEPGVITGVWGRKALADQPLQDRDRVELYRPLTVDPKVARRERFVKQGAKTAGLFARRRTGAKAGY